LKLFNLFLEIEMKIISWNVNSLSARIVDNETGSSKKKIRTVLEDSPMDKILKKNPDIICIQETKLTKEKEKIFKFPEEYNVYWSSSTMRKGYSGTCILSKIKPINVFKFLPDLNEKDEVNNEGRIIICIYKDFVLINTYTPNTQRAGKGDKLKEEFIYRRILWDKAIESYIKSVDLPIIWCGDLNVVRSLKDIYFGTKDKNENNLVRHHKCIKEFEKGETAGYRKCERNAIESIIDNSKLIDSYRYIHENEYGFTYWNQIKGVKWKQQNNGLRIDYFMVSNSIITNVEDVIVFNKICEGSPQPSDHAPIQLQIIL
jgi:exodeoxyribonuclease-3